MKKITFAEMEKTMFKFNCENPDKEDKAVLSAVIVFKPENWTVNYTETERSYRVWNNNRMFQPNKIASSLFMNCLDGKDNGVRWDWYRWVADYCYMEDSAVC